MFLIIGVGDADAAGACELRRAPGAKMLIHPAPFAGVNVPWLEQQTGIAYATMRKHYDQLLPQPGLAVLAKIDSLHVDLCASEDPDAEDPDVTDEKWCEEGDLNPKKHRK